MNEEIQKRLNAAIASELYGIYIYLSAAYNIKGPLSMEFRDLFEKSAEEEMAHLGQLAGMLAGFGGTFKIPAIEAPAPTTVEEALALAIQAETWAIQSYTENCKAFEELGVKALEILFENLVLDEQGHQHEYMILADKVGVEA